MSSPEHWQERQEAKARHGIRLQFPLRVAVRMWPEGPGAAYPKDPSREKRANPGLAMIIKRRESQRETFPTPTIHDSKNNNPPSQAPPLSPKHI